MTLGGILIGGVLIALWGLVIGASIYLEFDQTGDDQGEMRKEVQKDRLP